MGQLLGEGVLVQDENGIVIWFNAAVCRLLDATPEDLLNRTPDDDMWDLVDVDGNAISSQDLPGPLALRTGEAVENEVIGLRRSGAGLIWMSVTSALSTNAGRPAVISVFRDITVEQQSQRELDRTVVEINRTLVQKELPTSERVRFDIRSQPVRIAQTINGGLCGAYELDPTRFGFFVGNVRGRDLRASGISAAARHTLRSSGVLLDDPSRVLAHVHQTISNDWPDIEISALYGYLDMTDEGVSVRIASGGHASPLLIREGTASLVAAIGPPIGSADYQAGETTSFDVQRGDRLVLCTTDLAGAVEGESVVPNAISAIDANCSTDEIAEIASGLAMRTGTENGIDDDFTVLTIEFT